MMEFKIETAEQFWLKAAKDTIVERVVDDDAELIELQKAWLKMTNLLSVQSPVRAKKVSTKKQTVRPRRNARGAGSVPA